MTKTISMLAIDRAKGSFQVCAVAADGAVHTTACCRGHVWRRSWLSSRAAWWRWRPARHVAHHWGRVAQSHGREGRLVPAAYVKPFVKRQKNNRADAEAIAEAAICPTMRFVAVKSAETQGRAVAFRTH